MVSVDGYIILIFEYNYVMLVGLKNVFDFLVFEGVCKLVKIILYFDNMCGG